MTGPYEVTLLTSPDGIGEIDFNTLDIEVFPWQGTYFGGMENNIKAKVFSDFEDEYEFSHWMSTSGSTIFPDEDSIRATITLTQTDTLIAVFKIIGTVSANDLDSKFELNVFPNPANDFLILDLQLEETANVRISLHSVLGQKVAEFSEINGRQPEGKHSVSLSLNGKGISDGLYFLVVQVGEEEKSVKVNVVR